MKPTFLAYVIVAIAASSLVAAQTVCPLTGKAPVAPLKGMSRCLDSAAMTCCGTCGDIRIALENLSVNGTDIVNQISPGLGELLGGQSFKICDLFSGHEGCQHAVEQLMCALQCNPDSGNYVTTKGGKNPVLNVCKVYADKVYADCKAVSVPNFGAVETFFPTPADFLSSIVASVVRALGIAGFSTAITNVGTTTCYNGPKAVPKTPTCCDKFESAKQCPAGTVDLVKFKTLIGRPVDAKTCSKYGDGSIVPAPAPAMPLTPPTSTIPPVPTNSTPPPPGKGAPAFAAVSAVPMLLGSFLTMAAFL